MDVVSCYCLVLFSCKGLNSDLNSQEAFGDSSQDISQLAHLDR